MCAKFLQGLMGGDDKKAATQTPARDPGKARTDEAVVKDVGPASTSGTAAAGTVRLGVKKERKGVPGLSI